MKTPKEGDERVGVITVVWEDWRNYHTLIVPSLDEFYLPHTYGRAFLRTGRFNNSTTFHVGQLLMFRFMPWPGDPHICYWQPVLDYFESNR